MPDKNLFFSIIVDKTEHNPFSKDFFEENYSLPTDKQKQIFHMMKDRVDKDEGVLYNLDTPDGYGKTFVTNVMIAYVRMEGKFAIAAAMLEIAVTLLTLGTLFHCLFWCNNSHI